jgi:hypothetical protein
VSIRVRMQLLAATLGGLALCGVAVPYSTPFSSIPPLLDEGELIPPGEPVDRYGNEVRKAVASYKVDLAGEWYEEHSPDTEVPKLRPPKG